MSDVDTGASGAEATNAAVVEAAVEALDGQALVDSIATDMGWTPKDKWKGEPEKWRDSATFLRATPTVLKNTREQLERTNRAAQRAIERAREQAIADAEAKVAAAAEIGDAAAAKEAAAELRNASRAPDPAVQEFANRNPWYPSDEAATALAIATAEKVMQNGGSAAEQMAAAEREVRKRFPEHFDDELPEVKSSKGAPAVQGGQRSASPAPRERGWSDLPASVRQQVSPKVLKGFGMTEAEYAKSYWQEQA